MITIMYDDYDYDYDYNYYYFLCFYYYYPSSSKDNTNCFCNVLRRRTTSNDANTHDHGDPV